MRQIEITDAQYKLLETVAEAYGESIQKAFNRVYFGYIKNLYEAYMKMEENNE